MFLLLIFAWWDGSILFFPSFLSLSKGGTACFSVVYSEMCVCGGGGVAEGGGTNRFFCTAF